jgi:hypothetical protein
MRRRRLDYRRKVRRAHGGRATGAAQLGRPRGEALIAAISPQIGGRLFQSGGLAKEYPNGV